MLLYVTATSLEFMNNLIENFNFMKNIFFAIGFMCLGFIAVAQHAPQYSTFMFNKLAYNPAYAGSREVLTIGADYRNQWSGINGAPKTASIYAHTPFFKQRAGAGLSIISDQVGMMNFNYVNLSYNYRLPLSNGATLSLGLMGRLEHGAIDWTKADAIDQNDRLVQATTTSKVQPNFGMGVYYAHDNYYVGLSVPQVMKNALYTNLGAVVNNRNFYLMGGAVIKVNDNIKFKPAALISYNPNAPFEVEVNANFIFMDAFWVGASYRLGDSFDGVVAYQITKQIKAAIVADFTLSELKDYTTGSFEFLVEYSFIYDNTRVKNLRYF